MSRYYIGFDAGTQSVKVAVYDEDMNCLVQSASPTTLNYPEPGWVSMDCDEYLQLTIQGMKDCACQMKEKGLDINQVRSIMGDGIICGICGVDAEGIYTRSGNLLSDGRCKRLVNDNASG